MLLGNEEGAEGLIDMKKQRKNERHKKSHPEQDHFLMRIKQGERMYKFYYFAPWLGVIIILNTAF